MKRYTIYVLLSLLFMPVMALQSPFGLLSNKTSENLKPMKVKVPTKGQPKADGYCQLIISSAVHHFAHDGKLVYYGGVPLPDSDYRKKIKVVSYFYEQYYASEDAMMSAIPPMRFEQIVYISNNGNLYYQATKLEGADPKKFEGVNISVDGAKEEISDVYIRSNNRIYYRGKELDGINADKFHIIPGYRSLYASDDTNIYYCGNKLEGVDVGSFQTMKYHSHLSKDYKFLYCGNEIVDGIDGTTFEDIGYLHAKDKNGIYMFTYFPQCDNPLLLQSGGVECNGEQYFFLSNTQCNAMLGTTKDSVQKQGIGVHLCPYSKPENNVLKRIPAISESFEVIKSIPGGDYTKDSQNVFFKGEPIAGADPDHFRFLFETNAYIPGADPSYYTADNKCVFFDGELVEDADPETFKPLASIYDYYDLYGDKNFVYHRGRKVEELTAANFDISEYYYKNDGKVWLRVPYSNVLQFNIEAADMATFQTFDSSVDYYPCPYAKDCKHAYYRGMPMQGVDVASFQPYENSGYAYDKGHLYFNGQRVPITRMFNPEEFKIISFMETDRATDDYSRNVYAQDNSNMYYNGRVLQDYMPGCLPEFYNNSRNNNRFCIFVYCGGRIYCRGKLIKKGSKNAIQIHLYGSYVSPFWSDDTNIYYEDMIIANAEEGLKALNSEYAIVGGNRVFYMDKEITVMSAHFVHQCTDTTPKMQTMCTSREKNLDIAIPANSTQKL